MLLGVALKVAAAAIACSILTAIAAVHVYWAAGGGAGKDGAIPTQDGRSMFTPGPLATLAVAIVLLAMVALLAISVGWLRLAALPGSSAPVRIGVWLMVTVFALRAIGEFRYIGFFKRVRAGRFARLDTAIYSPLCVALALLIAAVAAT